VALHNLSTESAYRVQFLGSYADFDWGKLWTVKARRRANAKLRLGLQVTFANAVCQLCRTSAESARPSHDRERGWASPSNHCPADPANWSARTCTKGRLHRMELVEREVSQETICSDIDQWRMGHGTRPQVC
jgi:hypothetical protein